MKHTSKRGAYIAKCRKVAAKLIRKYGYQGAFRHVCRSIGIIAK